MNSRIIRRLTSFAVTAMMTVGVFATAPSASATPETDVFGSTVTSESVSTFTQDVDLNGLDLTKPFSITQYSTNAYGEQVVRELSFEPAAQQPRVWTQTTSAVVGTWSFFENTGALRMSFQVDMVRSGNQWGFSNARNLTFSAPLTVFSNQSLAINRAWANASFDAEVSASVLGQVLHTAWATLYTRQFWITATVSHNGLVRVSGNA